MNNWISVKDRLPENKRSVLLSTYDGITGEGEYRTKSKDWFMYRWGAKFSENEVTHWMPLPEPPEVEL